MSLPAPVPGLVLRARGHRAAMAVYGAAHFGKSLFWFAGETLFAFYLTEVAGLPAVVMGWVIALGLVVAAALDPVVDRLFARQLATVHGCARLQWLGSCASALALTPLFFSERVPEAHRLPIVILIGLAFRVAYALYDQPQNALIGRATGTGRDRTAVAALRVVLSGMAALAIAALATALAFGSRSDAAAGGTGFVAVSLLLSACAVGSATVLHSLRGPAPPPAPPQARREAFQGRLPVAAWVPLGIALATAITIPAFAKAQPYLVRYWLEAPLWGAMLGGAVPLGGMLSQPFWARLSAARSRHAVILIAAAFLSGGAILFWSTAATSPILAVAAALLIGIGNGGIAVTLWAAFGDAVARPAGQPGWSFGLLTAAMKLGLAAGMLTFGAILNAADYRAAHGAALVTIMALGPFVGGLCCALIVFGHARMRRARADAAVTIAGGGTLATTRALR